MTVQDERTPREIVARLHAEIAAMSPEHAALVAAFEALPRRHAPSVSAPRPLPVPGSPRWHRMTVYTGMRLAGASGKAAARRAGLTQRTGQNYEVDMLGVMGGAVRD